MGLKFVIVGEARHARSIADFDFQFRTSFANQITSTNSNRSLSIQSETILTKQLTSTTGGVISELYPSRAMTISPTADKGNDKVDANNSSADLDPSKSESNRRFNPYDGMDPSNPNFVDISSQDFRAMMKKKKAMGIPSMDVLKQKTKKMNLQSDVAVVSNEKEETKQEPSTNVETAAPPLKTQVPSKWKKFLKMQMAGVPNEAVCQLALVQGKTPTKEDVAELRQLLGMELVEDEPSKSTSVIIDGHNSTTARNSPNGKDVSVVNDKTQMKRFNEWFTPIQDEKKKNDAGDEDDDEEDDEKVAFHHERTSPLASLVRRMAHTVDKTRRKKGSTRGAVPAGDDDLVVTSKTLYQALGSFKGVQIARDNYNETLIATRKTDKKCPGAGWIRAKRQSFREIAKSIGVKLPSTNSDQSQNDATQLVTIEGLDSLVKYIETKYSEEIQESISLLRDDKLYDFDSLSTLYVPGSRVVAKNICSGGIDMICKVAWNRIKSGRTITGQISSHFEVCFEFVVAVGTNKATIAEVVEGIENFEGRRNIFSSTGLTFVPWMAYNQDEQELLLQKYRRRGRIYNEVALNRNPNDGAMQDINEQRPTYSYKAYRKGCFFIKRGGFGGTVNAATTSRGMATGGRIVIDSQGAYDYGNSLGVGYDPMITGIHYKLKEYRLYLSRTASDQQMDARKSKPIVDAAGNVYNSSTRPKSNIHDENDDGGMVLFDAIPEDYLELVWPSVIGFSLTAKSWGDCLVDGLEDIVFSEDIFDRLVLPSDRKRLIKALVKHSSSTTNGSNKHNFQDLIKGKGEGTVFLLYGPPGVGKTLTAEAVAEVLQRPLYSLSMGTLGTTADDLERRLTEILKLSAKWDAIILLDEADSFLEKRSSTSSLERNAMVSVMLQLVEYFTGILFLTSNRMDSLDPAFQTRITLSLPYYNLTEDGRQKIWENLLHKSGIANKGMLNTRELAKHPLNGREIKNALRMALALACEEDCPLNQKLLMETSSMVKPVSSYGISYEGGVDPSTAKSAKKSFVRSILKFFQKKVSR